MTAKIKFLGGVRTVTGSSHLVRIGKAAVLLDSGLFQGRRDEFYRVNTEFNYNLRKINAVVLSHAHMDHCGNLPSLIRNGLSCKVYSTHATKDLCRLMLEDSAKIQEEDIKYVNKINKRMGLPQREPLYNKRDASKAVKRIHPISYAQKKNIAPGISVTFYNAGHILGSGISVLDLEEGSFRLRLGYAVDLGRKNLPMLENPEVPKGVDYLIIESTYGGRVHAPIGEAKVQLRDAVSRTVERGGKIIIPAFSLERTQELIYLLGELTRENSIPSINIYVDSPLATGITDVFGFHADYLNKKTADAIREGNSPFKFLNLRFVRDQAQSKSLNTDKRPMIIIAGSGMCESGRVLHHLKNNIEDSRNTVLVVGYMAKNTLGRKIVEKNRFVRIFGVEYELNAQVLVLNSLSAHADKNELFEFVCACKPLKKVFLVHGDEDQSQIFADTLSKEGFNVSIPSKDEEAELN